MDKSEAKKITESLQALLTDALAKQGYNVAFNGGVFTQDSFNPKITISKAGDDLDKKEFERNAHLFGLKPEHYGKQITYGGSTFVLVGLNPGRPRFPVSVERVPDGKKFKLTESSLKQLNPNYGYKS